jgi:hypothetical protein
MKKFVIILFGLYPLICTSQNLEIGNSKFAIVSQATKKNENKLDVEEEIKSDYNIKKAKVFIKKLYLFPQFEDLPEKQIIKLAEITKNNFESVELENIFQKIVYAINSTFEKKSIEYSFCIGFVRPRTIPYTDYLNRNVTRVGYGPFDAGFSDRNKVFTNLGFNNLKVEIDNFRPFDSEKKIKTAKLNLYLYTYERYSNLLAGDSHTETLIDYVTLASVDLPLTSKQMGFEVIVHSSENGFELEYIEIKDFKNNPLEGTVFENALRSKKN